MHSTQGLHVGIVGATGAVGTELIRLLEHTALPVASLRLFGSARKSGRSMHFRDQDVAVEAADASCFTGLDIVFFSAGGGVSSELGPEAAAAGALVIDNSSAFRMDPDTPLVVPEVNAQDLPGSVGPGIIANPNCSTIIALVALEPIRRRAGIERLVVSTYQAASGGGQAMMDELIAQTRAHLDNAPVPTDVIGRPYAFNCFSHDSDIGPDGFNEEESKLVREMQKIWHDDQVRIVATCVRVPVLRAHTESIVVTTHTPIQLADVRQSLVDAPGVSLVDDTASNRFPEPLGASGAFDIHVGRVRMDPSQDDGRGLCLLVSGDQLLKGAALNAIQIAESVAGVQLTTSTPAPCNNTVADA